MAAAGDTDPATLARRLNLTASTMLGCPDGLDAGYGVSGRGGHLVYLR